MDIWQTIVWFFNDMMSAYTTSASDPLYYSIGFFIYTVLATIILPLPVELGLLVSPGTPLLVLALVLGLGRAAGSIIVLYAGQGIGSRTNIWLQRWRWYRRSMDALELIMARLNYLGLYIIMSIPLMPDTIPLYAFSISNENRRFRTSWFALTNFLAGCTRAIIFLALLDLFGLSLFRSLLTI